MGRGPCSFPVSEDDIAHAGHFYAMNAVEKRALDAIDYDGMYRFLEEIVYIPSFGGDESKAQWYMAKTLEEHGFAVDRWEIEFDELSKHPDFSMSYERGSRARAIGASCSAATSTPLLRVISVTGTRSRLWRQGRMGGSTAGAPTT